MAQHLHREIDLLKLVYLILHLPAVAPRQCSRLVKLHPAPQKTPLRRLQYPRHWQKDILWPRKESARISDCASKIEEHHVPRRAVYQSWYRIETRPHHGLRGYDPCLEGARTFPPELCFKMEQFSSGGIFGRLVQDVEARVEE